MNPHDDAASASFAMLASAPAATVPPLSIHDFPRSKSRPSLDLTLSTCGNALAHATLKYSSAFLGSDSRARCSSRNRCPRTTLPDCLSAAAKTASWSLAASRSRIFFRKDGGAPAAISA